MSLYRTNPRKNGHIYPANFPIKVETCKEVAFIPGYGAIDRYIVAANGFVIASFTSATCCATYVAYLKKYGKDAWNKFPKKMLEILEYQATGKPFSEKSNGENKA